MARTKAVLPQVAEWEELLLPFATAYRRCATEVHNRLSELSDRDLLWTLRAAEQADYNNCQAAVFGVAGLISHEATLIAIARGLVELDKPADWPEDEEGLELA